MSGEAYSTKSGMACAELWRRMWKAHASIIATCYVNKVAAHATDEDVARGYPQQWRDGNACADAAAKQALDLHPRNEAAEVDADLQQQVAKYMIKFFARQAKHALEGGHHIAEDCEEVMAELSKLPGSWHPAANEARTRSDARWISPLQMLPQSSALRRCT